MEPSLSQDMTGKLTIAAASGVLTLAVGYSIDFETALSDKAVAM